MRSWFRRGLRASLALAANEVTEKALLRVIPSEARTLSSVQIQERFLTRTSGFGMTIIEIIANRSVVPLGDTIQMLENST
jgi:hypothetical protein